MNSREKGKRGERQWRDQLREAGFQARRGQQYSGSPDSPDVVCPDLPSLHFEVKVGHSHNIYKAMAQAQGESNPGDTPVVAHKRDGGAWLVTVPAGHYFDLLRESDHVRRRAEDAPNEAPAP